MEWLQNINIDPSMLPYLAVGCALLCVIIVVIGFVLQAAGNFLDAFLGLAGVAADILEGGPVAWCGCALLLFGCIACAGIAFLFLDAPNQCAVYPTRFCDWFGFLP